MLSYAAMGLPHLVQLEAGSTMDLSAGIRRMQTFRKLPISKPNKNASRGITPRLCHTPLASTMSAARGMKQTGNSSLRMARYQHGGLTGVSRVLIFEIHTLCPGWNKK
jgi:hypothetical protein